MSVYISEDSSNIPNGRGLTLNAQKARRAYMTKNYRLNYWGLIIVGLLLFACSEQTPTPEHVDKSPFTGIPCAAPCWHGLVIGQSNESDVMSTLPSLTFINQNTINVHQMQSLPSLDPSIWGKGIEITIACINTEKQCVTIRVVENTLTEVVTVMNYNIRVDEAIKYLGDPDDIGFDRAGGEQIACQVFLVWKEKQLVLASQVFEGANAVEKNCYVIRDSGKVSSDLLIYEARYISIRTIEILLSSSAGEFFDFSGTIPESSE